MIPNMMRTGKLELQYAILVEGRLLRADKGLPPPKSGKDPATQAFLQAWWTAHEGLRNFALQVQRE